MNQFKFLAILLAALAATSPLHAERVNLTPEQLRETATHIVTGEVKAIFSRPDKKDTRYAAEVRVISCEKGKGIEKGALIYVRYVTFGQDTNLDGSPIPGTSGHRGMPEVGGVMRIHLAQNSYDGFTHENKDGGFNVIGANGFEKIAGDNAIPRMDQRKGDKYDQLYTQRIELFTGQIAVLESVENEVSANAAAEKYKALLTMQQTLNQQRKLDPPTDERQSELDEKYKDRISKLSIRFMKESQRVAGKPYGRVIHLAQLEVLAEQGNEEAVQALAVMKGGSETKAALQAAESASAMKREKIQTDPNIDDALKAYLESTTALNKKLEEVRDEASAKAAAPDALFLVKLLEAQSKAFDAFGPAAGKTAVKYETEMKTSMEPLVATVVKLHQNEQIAVPLKEVLDRIMNNLSGVSSAGATLIDMDGVRHQIPQSEASFLEELLAGNPKDGGPISLKPKYELVIEDVKYALEPNAVIHMLKGGTKTWESPDIQNRILSAADLKE